MYDILTLLLLITIPYSVYKMYYRLIQIQVILFITLLVLIGLVVLKNDQYEKIVNQTYDWVVIENRTIYAQNLPNSKLEVKEYTKGCSLRIASGLPGIYLTTKYNDYTYVGMTCEQAMGEYNLERATAELDKATSETSTEE